MIRSIGARMLLMPDKRQPEYYHEKFGFSHPSQIGLRYADQTLLTSDGFKLSYWKVENPNCSRAEGAIIYLHGITDSKVSGLNYAKELSKFCMRVYLIDMRRHGDSEGRFCTYGYYEKHDVAKLIDVIKQEDPGITISLLGNSMGAAIAIQTAAIDKRIGKVIAVAPFYDLFTIALDQQFRHLGIRNRTLLRLVLQKAERLANFKASEVSPARDMGSVEAPVLIVHGEDDRTIKKEYSQRLSGLNGRSRLLTIPNAGHKDVLERGGQEYVRDLIAFLKSP
ncbi:MAG TPA: alpha/beta fold hydrolase [Candidatus Kryptonia bacterium]